MECRRKVFSEANGNIDSKALFIAEAPGRLGADKTGIPLYGDRTGDNFELWQYPSTEHVDSSDFTAYTSGGTVIKQEGCQYQGVLDIDGHPYQFSGNNNFLHYYQAFASRQNDILGNIGGQTDLISQLSLVDNNYADVNAIVDARV